MSSDAEVDSFAKIMGLAPGSDEHRKSRDQRAKRERKTQQTEKQRRRRAVRTDQENFRCSPAFKARARSVAKNLGYDSLADMYEDAIEALAKAKGKGGSDA